MKNSIALKVIIVILTVALVASLGFLVHIYRQDHWWRLQVSGLAGQKGMTRALQDFQDGRLRLFVIAGARDDDTFSGTNDGPFQVWFARYNPRTYPLRYSQEQEVEFYNWKMRTMHENPDKSVITTNRRPNNAVEATRALSGASGSP